MTFKETISQLFSRKNKSTAAYNCVIAEDAAKIELQLVAMRSALSLIANQVALARFYIVDKDGNEVRDDEWYRWNYAPNDSQNKADFFREIVVKGFTEGQALVFQEPKRNGGNALIIADDFEITTAGIDTTFFESITKNGVTLLEKRKPQDVFVYEFMSAEFQHQFEEVSRDYATMLGLSATRYQKGAAEKAILKLDADLEGGLDQDDRDEAVAQNLVKFLKAPTSAAMPMRKGFEFEELGKYKQQQSAEDFEKLTKAVYSIVASATHVPVSLMLGTGEATATSENIKQLYQLATLPVLNAIEIENNKKLIHKYGLDKGYRFVVDGTKCLNADIFEKSSAIMNLWGCGFSNDEIRQRLGMMPLNEPWSKAHFHSLNFKAIDKTMAAEGGENNE